MPRNPVTVGVNSALKTTTKDAVEAQMFASKEGGVTSNTKERVLACSHGIMKNHCEESSDSDDESRVSNPPNWESNQARKTLDMQWYFTAGPLRVSGLAGKNHWRRLHASNTTMIPQPKGGLHVIKSHIPHKGDKQLEEDVQKSGVAKPRPERHLPPVIQRTTPGTPELRRRVLEAAVPPLPKRPKGPASTVSDGSSIFSVTTVARSAVTSKSTKKDTASVLSTLSAQPQGNESQTAPSAHQSEASVLTTRIEEEKKAVRDLSEELRAAADRLRYLEKVLSRRDRREP